MIRAVITVTPDTGRLNPRPDDQSGLGRPRPRRGRLRAHDAVARMNVGPKDDRAVVLDAEAGLLRHLEASGGDGAAVTTT
jgi:hypothetical protein